jgi:predicted GNAT superfamily acetyltransferase
MPEIDYTLMIAIRELKTFNELKQIEVLQRKIWQFADIDTIPLILVIAHREAGSMWLGAFEGPMLVGFAFGFLALDRGELIVHSHLVGVQSNFQDKQLGYRLKQAQRKWAMALHVSGQRIRKMTWTFDPLQGKNAYFNFVKLGVTADSYDVDLYGTQTSSPLHRNGTDRLRVQWLLCNSTVEDRLRATRPKAIKHSLELGLLVRTDAAGRPIRGATVDCLSSTQFGIQIPADIVSIERADPDLAREWREATRWAFTKGMRAGYYVVEFERASGTYVMQKRRSINGDC